MADNVVADAGVGGATFKTDEDTGASAHVPVTKIELGVNNTFDGYVGSTNPMPCGGPAAENAAVSGNPLLTGGRYDATPRTLGDGDVGAIALDADGAVHISDGGNTITVDGTITANAGTGTFTIQEASALDVSAATVTTTSAAIATEGSALGSGILLQGDDGTDRKNINVDATTGDVQVDVTNTVTVSGTVTADAGSGPWPVTDNGGSLTIDNATLSVTGGGTETGALRVTLANNSTGVVSVDDGGSTLSIDDGGGAITVDGTVTANAGTGTWTVDLGSNNDVQGDIAHNAVDSGNPLKIGAKVETSPKGITVAADADRTDLYADADGQLVVKVGTTGADLISERVSDTTGNSTGFTNFSAVASTYNYVTAITIANTSASDAYVDFRDGTAGSVKWTVPIPANGGATVQCGGTPLFKTSANTALAYDVSSALSTVYISVSGYQSKV